MTTTPDPIAAIERAPTWLHETEIARLAASFEAGQHPAWVRVEQDGVGVHGGFYTCAAATENSPAYIRADIALALARQAEPADAVAGVTWGEEHVQRFIEALCAEDIGDPLRASAERLEAFFRHVLSYTFRRPALVDVPAVESEPVAWRYRYEDGKWTVQKNKPHWFKEDMRDVELEPLYAHPPRSTLAPAPAGEDGKIGSLKNALEMTGCENEEDLIDMANVGNSLMERIDSLVSMPGPYHHWSPADDPAEIVFDLVNDLDEVREEAANLRDALEQIAGQKGQFSAPFPDGREGYSAFAVMTARAALSRKGSDAQTVGGGMATEGDR